VISDDDISAPAGLQAISAASLELPGGTAPLTTQVGRDSIQLILATSGTQGEAKGVMISASNIDASVSASRSRLGLSPGDIWLNCMPLFHIAGLAIIYRCLDARAAVLLHQGFNADLVWRDIQRCRVTHISLVPAMLQMLLDETGNSAPPDTLRVVLVGGGRLSCDLARSAHQRGWPLCVTYGMSETVSQFATDCGARAGVESGLVGLPLDGYEVSLSDGDPGSILPAADRSNNLVFCWSWKNRSDLNERLWQP